MMRGGIGGGEGGGKSDEGGRGAGEGMTKGVDASDVWRDHTCFLL